jgi:hypothetical protein
MAMAKLVNCEKHGTGPGYIVCLHVSQGVKPIFFEKATENVLGQALCGDCHARIDLTAEDGMLVCAGCFANSQKKHQKRNVIFILDGGPGPGPCGIKIRSAGECVVLEGDAHLPNCSDPPTGMYEIVDADTNERLGSVQLCRKHGEQLATGPAA